MALTRAVYLEHFRRMVARGVQLAGQPAVGPLVNGAMDYVTTGTFGTQADRTEAAYILVNLLWQQLLGHPYNGHQIKHGLAMYGVNVATDPPNISEPTS